MLVVNCLSPSDWLAKNHENSKYYCCLLPSTLRHHYQRPLSNFLISLVFFFRRRPSFFVVLNMLLVVARFRQMIMVTIFFFASSQLWTASFSIRNTHSHMECMTSKTDKTICYPIFNELSIFSILFWAIYFPLYAIQRAMLIQWWLNAACAIYWVADVNLPCRSIFIFPMTITSLPLVTRCSSAVETCRHKNIQIIWKNIHIWTIRIQFVIRLLSCFDVCS